MGSIRFGICKRYLGCDFDVSECSIRDLIGESAAGQEIRGIEVILRIITDEDRILRQILRLERVLIDKVLHGFEDCEAGAAADSARRRFQQACTGVEGGVTAGTLSNVKCHSNLI